MIKKLFNLFILWFGIGCCSFAFAVDGVIPGPQDTVQKLYQEHLKNPTNLAAQRKNEQNQYRFGPELLRVWTQDNWGFDPLFFAQDFEVKELVIKEVLHDKQGFALVAVSFKNFGKQFHLIVSLSHTDHGYQILNITNPETGDDLIHDLLFK